MQNILQFLSQRATVEVLVIFLVENFLITLLTLIVGDQISRRAESRSQAISKEEWIICGVTNVLDTVITFLGFKLWQNGVITITYGSDWLFPIDVIIIFLAMDFLMFVFHYLIHQTFLYTVIHGLHHKAVDPRPIHLFVLHPVETLAFGLLWLFVLCLCTFNIYAIVFYLILNVTFGLIGHLGFEPVPLALRNSKWLRYLGTSSFHHQHHKEVRCNFGFYTSIWDRLFGTYQS